MRLCLPAQPAAADAGGPTFRVVDRHLEANGEGVFPFGWHIQRDKHGYDAWADTAYRRQFLSVGNAYSFDGNRLADEPLGSTVGQVLEDVGSDSAYVLVTVDFWGATEDTPLGSHSPSDSLGHYPPGNVPKTDPPTADRWPVGAMGDPVWHRTWFEGVARQPHFARRLLAWYLSDEPFNPSHAGGYDGAFEGRVVRGHDAFAASAEGSDRRLRLIDVWRDDETEYRRLRPCMDLIAVNDYADSLGNARWRTANAVAWAASKADSDQAVVAFAPGYRGIGLLGPEDARYYLYAAVVHGARGIFFWTTIERGNRPVADFASVGAAWREWRAYALDRALFASDWADSVAVLSGDARWPAGRRWGSARYGRRLTHAVSYLARRYEGRLYLIAVNDGPRPRTVTFRVRGLPPDIAALAVLGEGRAVALKEGADGAKTFQDSFGGNRAHVYLEQLLTH